MQTVIYSLQLALNKYYSIIIKGNKIMENTYFSHNEAKKIIGRNIEALYDFPSVPKGCSGTVIKSKVINDKNWIVRVKWNIPQKSSLYLSQFGDFSFNFIRKSKDVIDDFSKYDYYKLVKEK